MAKCPCCRQQLPDQTFYIRWFDHTPGKRRLWQDIFGENVLFVADGELNAVVGGTRISNGVIIGLQTGIIYRNNSEKALPKFATEPLLRAAIANGAALPPIYKSDKKGC